VKAGRWEEAMEYLSRFLPSDRLLSVHGRALLHFLRVHKAIDAIVAGAPEGRAVSAALKICFSLDRVSTKGITKLRAMLWSLICYTKSRYIHHTSIYLFIMCPDEFEPVSKLRTFMYLLCSNSILNPLCRCQIIDFHA
jgi:hypothetical protein